MTLNIENVFHDALMLDSSERIMLINRLIESFNEKANESPDQAWLWLAQKRYEELKSNEVKPVSWNSIKEKIKHV